MKLWIPLLFLALPVAADILPPRPATQAEAAAGVLTTPYISPATMASGVTGAGGVTNRQATVLFSSNVTTYARSPLTVSGCTTFPFLNSTNWQLWTGPGETNGIYVLMPAATNFLFFDATNNVTMVFATNFHNTTSIMEQNFGLSSSSGSIDDLIGSDNGQWTPDSTLTISYGITNKNTTITNFGLSLIKNTGNGGLMNSIAGSVISQRTAVGAGPVYSITDMYGERLVEFDQDPNSGNSPCGRINMWGGTWGAVGFNGVKPATHNCLRINGFDRNISSALDQRVCAIWGHAADNTGTNGGELLLVSASAPAAFNYGYYLDNAGNTMLGRIDSEYSTVDTAPLASSAMVDIVQATKTNIPQFRLEGGLAYKGNTNGAIWNDTTNVNFTGVGVVASTAYSKGTNTLSVNSIGVTNSTSVAYLLSITAGSAMVLKDANGQGIIAPVVNNTVPLKPGWGLAGSGITAIAIQFP